MALSERFAVIGAPREVDTGEGIFPGSVEIVDLQSGSLSTTLYSPNFGQTGFGWSVAVSGNLLLVGAPFGDGGPGAAYLFDLRTGNQLRELLHPGSFTGDLFGASVALSGGRAVIGSPNGNYPGSGGAYFFDLITGGPGLAFPEPPGTALYRLGEDVAIDGNLALIGSNTDVSDNAGKAFLYEVSSRNLRGSFESEFESNEIDFGKSVALCGDQAVIGAARAVRGGLNGAGLVHFYRPLVGSLPLETITQVRDFAPGTIEADFRNFQQPLINPDGEVFFTANLVGPGTRGGRNQGLWTNFEGSLGFLGISGGSAEIIAPDLKIGRMLRFVSSRGDSTVFEVLLRGPGATGRNNRVLLTFDGSQADQLRTGTPLAALGDAEVQILPEILQTSENQSAKTDRLLLPYRPRRGPGEVNPTNDTGVLMADSFGGAIADTKAREGEPASGLDTFGQFFGRAAASSTNFYAFSAFVIPEEGGRPFPACFTTGSGFGLFSVASAPRGADAQPAPQFDGGTSDDVVFRAILGEAVDSSGFGIVKAVRSGNANNFAGQGIWREGLSAVMFEKGTPLVSRLDGSLASAGRILRFWPVGTNQVLVLAKGFGRGVNASNDCALVHVYPNPSPEEGDSIYLWETLVREGDPVSAWDCPRVRTIQRVEVDPINGNYAVVVALTGAPIRNQALLTGNTLISHPNPDTGSGENSSSHSSLRLPRLALRKGMIFNTPHSESTRLRSIVMQPIVDRTGAGGKGHGQVLNRNGELVLCLQFDNRAKELVVGKP